MRNHKSAAITAGLLSLTLLFTGCSSDKLASTKEESTPVMKVNEYDVPYELYRYVAMNYKNQYETGLDESAAAELWLGESGKILLAELETNTTETGVFNGDSLILGTRQVSVSNENGVNVSAESWFIDSANNVNVKTAMSK